MAVSPFRQLLATRSVHARSWWRTPAAFRPYLAEAMAFWGRGERVFRAWTPHLNKSLAVLDTTIDDIASRRTVVVLGAGPLFDVPLESLARTFERVILVDRVHLAATDRRLRPYRNVERLWRDLSPVGDDNPLGFLDAIAGLDWVISANLLSELGRNAPEGEARATIARHLEALSRLTMPVTLITDIDYRVFGHEGTLLEEADLLHGLVLPFPEGRWLWEVAPFGEASPDTRRIHTVVAFPDWHARHRLLR